MWCITFSLFFSSWYIFGISVVAHFVLILAIVVTVATFVSTERMYRFKDGYHSMGRARGSVMYRGKDGTVYKVPLPKNDPGGEHD
jgi:formate hydrogenlyase subunit 3/multisubunit Na+/H+ antiporter MnhD subunit